MPSVAIFAFVLLSLSECVRAQLYLNSAADYRGSSSVQTVVGQIESLVLTAEKEPAAVFCDLSAALSATFNDKANQINDEIKKNVVDIPKPPSFKTIMVFLPRPNEAKTTSDKLRSSLNTISSLSAKDARSTYCMNLATILSSVYFVSDLKNPEAVSALIVGQLETFQLKMTKAQESLVALRYPQEFEAEHLSINEVFVEISKNLRSDENRYVQFARSIEARNAELESIFENISNKSVDLQNRPALLKLATAGLENQH